MMTYVNQLSLCCYRTILWCYRTAYYFFLRIYSPTLTTLRVPTPHPLRSVLGCSNATAGTPRYDEQPLRTDDVT